MPGVWAGIQPIGPKHLPGLRLTFQLKLAASPIHSDLGRPDLRADGRELDLLPERTREALPALRTCCEGLAVAAGRARGVRRACGCGRVRGADLARAEGRAELRLDRFALGFGWAEPLREESQREDALTDGRGGAGFFRAVPFSP